MNANVKTTRVEKSKIEFFQKNIIEWYNKNGRDFPWRKKRLTNYHKVISEVLLQRTRAETVAKFYPIFIKKYPSWNNLNKTRLGTLEKILTPIGLYKQRARRLKWLAKEMVKRNGRLPKTKEEIEKLPFAGQYITNAILQFVWDKPAPLLDVNMARVLERFFGERKLADIRFDLYLQDLAWRVVNHNSSKRINWGILDFASVICKTKLPCCYQCVLKKRCGFIKQEI